MKPASENVPSVKTPDDDTLFEGQTWGWDVIDFRAAVSNNQNYPYLKNGWIPQSLSNIDILLHCIPLKWLIIVLLPSTSRSIKKADIDQFTCGYLLRYLGLWL